MLLTISTTHGPPSDLGFLLHKHPDRIQQFELGFGKCHVFYPESNDSRCTVALLLDVDPVQMARGKQRQNEFALAGYVNDRPFVASSFISVAIAQVFGTALSGRCKQRPALVNRPIDLRATIDVLPVRGGMPFLNEMFEPLGYQIQAESVPLDIQFPDWGESHYFSVTLTNTICLKQMLGHLYVLIPVFDHQKHYFVGPDESKKLLEKGKGWLEKHPGKQTIAKRYLKYQPSLARRAIEQLGQLESSLEPDSTDDFEQQELADANPESRLEKKISLHDQRLDLVCQKLLESGANRVIDLGCGEGKLLGRLIKQKQFSEIVGMDVAIRSLEIAHKRLRLDELPAFQVDRIKLIHGSLMYRDSRFAGFDAAAIVEVIEHLDPPRLLAFERVVFQHARPATVVLTTPNSEYNVMWTALQAGTFRHSDHRFEWNRSEFENWTNSICDRFEYQVQHYPVGPIEDQVGAPTQMAVFRLATHAAAPTSGKPKSERDGEAEA